MANEQKEKGRDALLGNLEAVRAAKRAVAGTLGPKGMDTLLVDEYGNVLVTNDGMTILSRMEAPHPAARMLISAAGSQQEKTGDGTTTTAVLTAEIVERAAEQIQSGVPAVRVAQGILEARKAAAGYLAKMAGELPFDEQVLFRTVLPAVRGRNELAGILTEAALLCGPEKLKSEEFSLRSRISVHGRPEMRLVKGTVVNQTRALDRMPERLEQVRVLLLDDRLGPEEVRRETLSTEYGSRLYEEKRREFLALAGGMAGSGIRVILTTRGTEPDVLEMLARQEILVVDRAPYRQLRELSSQLAAPVIRMATLSEALRNPDAYTGLAGEVSVEQETVIFSGGAHPLPSLLIGGETPEISEELGRMAEDGAGTLQAAVRNGGVVPGGGVAELLTAEALEEEIRERTGATRYGWLALAQALRRPFLQMAENAGLSPLELLERFREHTRNGGPPPGMDYDRGILVSREESFDDPLYVKLSALAAASETAAAIVRIENIVRMKSYGREKT